jgi:1-acyl-sn-glycerol-3-phosphate acyltransferase
MTFIALRSNAPVLPMAITGAKDLGSNLKRLRRTEVKIVIGQPFRFRPSGTTNQRKKVRRDVLQQMTEEAMYQLAAILPSAYRGVYSDLDSATERFLVFEEG